MKKDWVVLLTVPSLRYRLLQFAGSPLAIILIILAIFVVRPFVIGILYGFGGETAEKIVILVSVLCFFVLILLLLTAVSIGWDDLKNPPYYEVTVSSVKRTRFTPAEEDESESVLLNYLWPGKTKEPEWRLAEIKLEDIGSIQLSQGRIARQLNYGDIVFRSRTNPKRGVAFFSVDKPTLFKERVEWLVKHQPLISQNVAANLQSDLNHDSERLARKDSTKASAAEVNVGVSSSASTIPPLRYSLFLALPVTLVGGNAFTFVFGFIAGLILGPLLGIGLASAWSTFILGVSSVHAIIFYGKVKRWLTKALVALTVSLLNGSLLGTVVYALGGNLNVAGFVVVCEILIVLFFGIFKPIGWATLVGVYELWEKPREEKTKQS